MLTPEERLAIGLKVLERLRPGLSGRRLRDALPLLAQILAQNTPPGEAEVDPEQLFAASKILGLTPQPADAEGFLDEPDVWEPVSEPISPPNGPEIAISPPAGTGLPGPRRLPDLLAQVGTLEPPAALLGRCEDGLPAVLDLADPAPGAVLVCGDPGSGKTRLLQSVLASAAALNSPGQVSFSIVARNPGEYASLAGLPNCQGLRIADGASVDDLLAALAEEVERRRRGGGRGPARLLAIDGLLDCVQNMPLDTLAHLYSLLHHGPRVRIWVVAALSSQELASVDEHLLAAFRTRVLAHLADPFLAAYLAGNYQSGAAELEAGNQYTVRFGDEWVRFWVCDPE